MKYKLIMTSLLIVTVGAVTVAPANAAKKSTQPVLPSMVHIDGWGTAQTGGDIRIRQALIGNTHKFSVMQRVSGETFAETASVSIAGRGKKLHPGKYTVRPNDRRSAALDVRIGGVGCVGGVVVGSFTIRSIQRDHRGFTIHALDLSFEQTCVADATQVSRGTVRWTSPTSGDGAGWR